MHIEFLKILRCPQTGQQLRLEGPVYSDRRVREGWLVSDNGMHRYPIRDFIPRFVPASNYADNFGMQWNKFKKTQLDSYSGLPISANRYWKATGWKPDEIKGQWVLDAGCGAGRFAEVALAAGANVVALDYSTAVDACYTNLKHHPNLHVVQGDIYALPFMKGFFQFIYSLGVLQHTPNVDRAFAALPPMVNGRLCVDVYEKTWKRKLLPRHWLHPITKTWPKEKLLSLLSFYVPKLLVISRLLGSIPLLGNWLKRLVPVANYYGMLPLSEQQHLEWSLLDTFDWLSPEFDNPQTATTVKKWFIKADMEEIEVLRAGHLVGRGKTRDAARY
jgi:SAM-dependent methyltransferase